MKKFRERRVQINFPELEGLTLKKLFRMVRFTTFIFFLSLMQVMAVDSYAQMTKLSLNVENEQLEKVLKTIEDESEFFFLYNKDLIDVEQEISVDAQNETIKSILDGLLDGKDIAYTVYDRQIVLSNTEVIAEMVAQQSSISGTVTDEAGDPLPGVTVIIKGTTQGTVTNSDGNFSITNLPEGAILAFSFVGMLTQEIVVGTQTEIKVIMVTDAIGLEEVVAIGYGTVKKSDLTGSVGSMKAAEIAKQPVVRVDQALQGRIAGVQVSSTSGAPGSGSSIRIRGGNSINAGNEPLYVIDGFIGGGDLNAINPNDIESVEVLKDASATAIYGSRGSNGVILITTKRGTGKKGFGVSLDSYVGIQSPVKK
jgi:TonB-dependent SusC/RagA subfamily outer membrane receptor